MDATKRRCYGLGGRFQKRRSNGQHPLRAGCFDWASQMHKLYLIADQPHYLLSPLVQAPRTVEERLLKREMGDISENSVSAGKAPLFP